MESTSARGQPTVLAQLAAALEAERAEIEPLLEERAAELARLLPDADADTA